MSRSPAAWVLPSSAHGDDKKRRWVVLKGRNQKGRRVEWT